MRAFEVFDEKLLFVHHAFSLFNFIQFLLCKVFLIEPFIAWTKAEYLQFYQFRIHDF